MGLRCLLGHDFGEPETERERTEEGNEVVVTVREVKTCQRCGEKQVVSENKEITSIEQLRESATGESPATEPSAAAGSDADTAEEWGTDELSPGRDESAPEPEPGADEPTPADSEPAEGPSAAVTDADEDPVERGVADIIEQAERDDDMLQGPSEPADAADEAADDEDDVPVHPGQRSAAAEESEIPDAEDDDGVILDEDDTEPPENARTQWEEEASPEEVPGQDPEVEEPATPEGAEAEIIDAESDPSVADSDAEATESTDPVEPTEPDASDTQQSSTPSAVESEDAEIVDAEAGPADPEPADPEPTPSEREETDEGHMPWPDAPGEDEGHDATTPDGEPADIDFGEEFVADDEPESTASSPTDPEPVETDRENGDRTPTGESSDASTAPTANVDLERSSRDAELEYYCPECGLTRDVGNSSMRAGDICPECRVGYITEQQKAE
ncbi:MULTISPECIES: DUF7093 family protein [Halolamina]|uniref:Uncharacterized protein n=1 Tax=Halolamina pelagica TaxID=699431 RepID=A0A1I5RYI3_9EURY|nr:MULTISPECIES: hypothetical protein [Halolamina]NHX35402.1 hypothetical protein [Halolamina sp. R1-12]SFP63381.1 hypothetical protein SAMN05216277_105200 [Halolamina pelagica]